MERPEISTSTPRQRVLRAAIATALGLCLTVPAAVAAVHADASGNAAAASAGNDGNKASKSDSSAKAADRRFLDKATKANEKEVAAAQLGVQQASSPQVREYAQMLLRDHQDMLVKVDQVSVALGLSSTPRYVSMAGWGSDARQANTPHPAQDDISASGSGAGDSNVGADDRVAAGEALTAQAGGDTGDDLANSSGSAVGQGGTAGRIGDEDVNTAAGGSRTSDTLTATAGGDADDSSDDDLTATAGTDSTAGASSTGNTSDATASTYGSTSTGTAGTGSSTAVTGAGGTTLGSGGTHTGTSASGTSSTGATGTTGYDTTTMASTDRNATATTSTTQSVPAEATNDPAVRKLASQTGAQFDKAFVDHMVAEHEKAIAEFTRASKDQSLSQQSRDLATQALPGLRNHLEQAKSLRSSLGSSASS